MQIVPISAVYECQLIAWRGAIPSMVTATVQFEPKIADIQLPHMSTHHGNRSAGTVWQLAVLTTSPHALCNVLLSGICFTNL